MWLKVAVVEVAEPRIENVANDSEVDGEGALDGCERARAASLTGMRKMSGSATY